MVVFKENKEKDRKVTLNIKGVDEQLRREFKSVCAIRGVSITQEIQRIMREEVQRHKEKVAKEAKK
jgi:uncharacterized protein YhbP (UPF0306 family)